MSTKDSKAIVFGATGKVGISVVVAGLTLGHELTAFVRNEYKLRQLLGGHIPAGLRVVVGDALNEAEVSKAMQGHESVVNAAASSLDMNVFHRICRNIVDQAEKHLEPPKRVWLFGGVPVLKVPGKEYLGIDLPGMPKHFEVHRQNYELLLNSSLDWSFMCPGPMYYSDEWDRERLKITQDIMPFDTAAWSKYLPSPFQSLIFLSKVSGTAVPYQAVANLIMDNLNPDGPYSRKRLGITLEKG